MQLHSAFHFVRLSRVFSIAFAGLVVTLMLGAELRGDLLVYEGFDYAPGSLVGLNGGTGFGGAWDETQGSSLATDVEAGSLSYTDSLGNSLLTTGGKMNNNGVDGTSQPGRDLAFRRDGATLGATDSAPVYTYFSFLGVRQGDLNTFEEGNRENYTYGRGANISLFDGGCIDCANGDFERLNLGENSGHQFPVTTGADFLSIQRGDHPATHPLLNGEQPTMEDFARDYGRSGPTATRNFDFWQFGAPRIDISSNTSADPPYVDPEDGEIPSGSEANAVLWQENPLNGRFGTRFTRTPFAGETSLVVVRFEHYGASGDGSKYGEERPDKLVIWMNPDLSAEPSEADADVVLDFADVEQRAQDINDAGGAAMAYRDLNDANILSFDRIRFFAGNPSGARAAADWLIDELRIGETYADVTPIAAPAAVAGVPEPGTLCLCLASLAIWSCRRRG